MRAFKAELWRCYPENGRTSTLPHRPARGYEQPMSARVRKLIGLVGILAFLAGYIVAVSKLADLVPKNIAAQTLFYVVVGIGWGVPIIPFIRWMNSGR
jgi:hypothetical protein